MSRLDAPDEASRARGKARASSRAGLDDRAAVVTCEMQTRRKGPTLSAVRAAAWRRRGGTIVRQEDEALRAVVEELGEGRWGRMEASTRRAGR